MSNYLSLTGLSVYDEKIKELIALKQAKRPNGTDELIQGGKINSAYLPSSLVGQLTYKGSFSAATGTVSGTVQNIQVGWYYVCSEAGTNNPFNVCIEGVSYTKGDYAVYNGSGFDIVSGLISVQSVNGKTGAVEIYSGVYSEEDSYNLGEIILSGSQLYICIADAAAGTSITDVAHFLPFMRFTDIPVSGSGLGISSGAVYSALLGKVSTSRTVNGHALSSNIELNKEDIGLSNCDNTSDENKPISVAVSDALAMKVDKISGKGLSENDYTSAEKQKLSGIATGANAYVLPTASAETLGGIKVGTNLSIMNGVLSADAQSVTVDGVPTSGSGNAVSSGGVYSALSGKEDSVTAITTTEINALFV